MARRIDDFERTPANFRALRDMVGMKQDEFAEMVGVDRSEIRRMDGGKQEISDLAWHSLGALLDEHIDWVDSLTSRATKRKGDGTEPDGEPVRLVYYRSYEDYDQDYGSWMQADLVARAAAERLLQMGFSVEFVYPPSR